MQARDEEYRIINEAMRSDALTWEAFCERADELDRRFPNSEGLILPILEEFEGWAIQIAEVDALTDL